MKARKTLSLQEAKENLDRNGVSIRSWALKNNFTPSLVNSVMKGKVSCRIGASHKIAVLLGIKDGEIDED